MKHFRDETLFDFTEGITPIEAGVGEHVASCEQCAGTIAELRDVMQSLSDDGVWEKLPEIAPLPFLDEVAAFAERFDAERQEAATLCRRLLTGPSPWWPQRFSAAGNEALTAGLVLELLDQMRARVERSPQEALQITEMATGISERLDRQPYPPHFVDNIRGQAWRDHAFVLWFLGRFHEARRFADQAAQLYASIPEPIYENARLSLVRALILQNLGERAEAARLCREAGDTFLRLGERARFVKARMTEGVVLYAAGAVQAALDAWLSIEGDGELAEVDAIKLQHNIALCRSDLGHPELAIEPLRACVAQYELHEMATETARTRVVLGRVLLASGYAREAERILREASRELGDLGLAYDFSLAAMEHAEALIALGRVGEVPPLCREVIARLTAAGVASHAITALSYLRQVESGAAPVTAVKKVAETLRADRPML